MWKHISDHWHTYPLRSESQNGIALQDYARYVGNPTSLKTDNAKSELGSVWKDHCWRNCIPNYTTEPHSPWQNPVERSIQDLSSMVQLNMAKYDAPLEFHDYCQEYLCDVHNILANRKLNWKTPLEISEGNTPDISKFHFHFYEPVWYYNATIKSPKYQLLKGRFLG